MNRDEYKAITSGQGAKIRNFLKAAANPHASTHRPSILADLDDAGITDGPHRAALVSTYVELVKKARAGDVGTFELRQAADELTVKHVRAIRAADDLLDDDGIPQGTPNRDDADKQARRVLARARGMNDEQFEQQEADNAERARLERLGVKTGTGT